MVNPQGSLGVSRISGVAAVAVVAALLTPGTAFADAGTAGSAPMRIGSAPTAPADAKPAAEPAADTPLRLSVTLSPRDPGALKQFAGAVSDPKSPQYHHYLKTGQFAQVFGADKATVDTVAKALADAGLHPGALEADGLTIPVDTTVATAKRAFDTGFAGYRLADGSTAYANTAAPALPRQAAAAISGVVGLNTLTRAHNHLASTGKPAVLPSTGTAIAPHNIGVKPQICAGLVNFEAGQSPAVTNRKDYYSYDALAQLYGMDGQTLPDGGAGTTVALYELEDYSDGAVNAFQNCYGTHSSVSRVKVAGSSPNVAPTAQNGVGFESALDIDTVIGLAPGANILVYQGTDAASAGDQAQLDVWKQIVNENRAQVISTSWGTCEANLIQYNDTARMQAENLLFQQAAAQGQTVVAASGDSGSMDCSAKGAADTRLSTDDPASQPFVTGVGGTTMTGGAGPLAESVWNHDGGASGGGLSQMWPVDGVKGYQAGLTPAGYSSAPCKAAAGQACRQVPDVAALADPNTGYLISPYADAAGSVWAQGGGTSAAAPVWAAIAAQADASAACAAGGPVGQLNPALYPLSGSSSLHDITVGNNDVTNSGGVYKAGTGYDLATGLGTPNGGALVSSLCHAQPASPAGTFTATPPSRLLDTRNAIGRAGTGKVPAYGSVTLKVSGQSGVPTTGLTAVVLNVTVTESDADGHLTVYPAGGTAPTTSNLNWTAGTTIPNLVTVPVSQDGQVTLYNGSWGATHLLADVFGYYTSANPTGPTFTATSPDRLLDTRTSAGGAKVPAYGSVSLPVTGGASVPATGVTAVVLNVTVTEPDTAGHLTVVPSGTDPTASGTSNLNWTAGQTIPNQVIVPVGPDGKVTLYNGSWGATHVIADVFGYFSTNAGGASFHTSFPHRLMDTRSGIGTDAPSDPLAPNQTRTLMLDTKSALGKAKAVVLNITVTQTASAGHLTVWPTGIPLPNSSNLNWQPGETIPNLVTVPVGPDGGVNLTNAAPGNTDVIVDLFGYYS